VFLETAFTPVVRDLTSLSLWPLCRWDGIDREE
jgi:hypothetical protein